MPAAKPTRDVAVTLDEYDSWRVLKGRVAFPLRGEPVEIQPLVTVAECIERVTDPNVPAGQGDLLGEGSLGQYRRSMGLPQG